ncbi:MAG: branched-chain amino acid ABC transporter permease [Pseudomonadota bacterium]
MPQALKFTIYLALLAFTAVAPFAFPQFGTQLATLWLFIIVALTWDLTGGQMGYNSLGNIFFYGTGMYVAAVVAIALVYNVAEYTDASGGGKFDFTPVQYFTGLALGTLAAGVFCAVAAVLIGWLTFGMRGPYFAIGTLGVAIAAGELVSNWDYVGGGQGISLPVYPGDLDEGKIFFYYLFAAVGVATIVFLSWLYSTRFGAALNAIRDDEEKAEGMGIHTLRYKLVAWAIAAFMVGMAGAISAFQLIHFEPLETAYQTINLGIFMVVCVLLGGKGTLWGPVIGAIVFHVFKEVTWNYFLGWQWVALGALIVVIVVYFQEGIMGWLMRQRPEWFGVRVDEKETSAPAGAAPEAAE